MSSQQSFAATCESGYLTIRLLNEDIIRRMEPTFRAVSAYIEETKPKVLLIDFREIAAPTSFIERYQLGEMAGRYLPWRPVAVVVRPDQLDRGYIGRTVANNRGALVEIFTDPAEAAAWLKQHANPTKEP